MDVIWLPSDRTGGLIFVGVMQIVIVGAGILMMTRDDALAFWLSGIVAINTGAIGFLIIFWKLEERA